MPFYVEPWALDQVADGLRRAGEELRAVGRALGDVGGLDRTPSVAAAAEHFADRWQGGLDRTGAAAQAAADRLTGAARQYGSVDAAVAAACS